MTYNVFGGTLNLAQFNSLVDNDRQCGWRPAFLDRTVFAPASLALKSSQIICAKLRN